MSDIVDRLKFRFKSGDMLMKLIYVNVAVFLTVNLFHIIFWLFGSAGINFYKILAVPSSFHELLLKPWTIITYMFYHEGFWHILFNLIVLYFAGQIFLEFLGEHRLLFLYLAGGIAGAVLFIFTYNTLPSLRAFAPNAILLGASAAIMAVLIGICTYAPNYSVDLMFIGSVKLKYIAIFYIVLDFISLPHGNAGGEIAHIGGALYGFLYIKQMQKGKDWANYFGHWNFSLKRLFKNKPKMKVSYKNENSKSGKESAQNSNSNQAKIDAILDKISRTGYDSLTKEEKNELFKASQE